MNVADLVAAWDAQNDGHDIEATVEAGEALRNALASSEPKIADRIDEPRRQLRLRGMFHLITLSEHADGAWLITMRPSPSGWLSAADVEQILAVLGDRPASVTLTPAEVRVVLDMAHTLANSGIVLGGTRALVARLEADA